MKLENLEALLLDRSLGELAPAVAELLEEHLARDPRAMQQAALFTTTIQLARRATGGPAPASLPLPAPTRLRQAQRQLRWRSHLGELAKLAACVALGLVLGQALRPESAMVRAPAAVVTATPAGNSVLAPRFWSVASLAAEQRRPPARSNRREPGGQWRWESPLKMPRMEEKP